MSYKMKSGTCQIVEIETMACYNVGPRLIAII
jgi:hypothetical protein